MLTNTKFVERRYRFRSVMMKVNDATPFSSSPVFLAIRSMSAIGIICHWSLAPPAATRFPSSIIIAVIVLPTSRAIPSRPFDAKHLQQMIIGRGGVKRSRLLDLLSLTKKEKALSRLLLFRELHDSFGDALPFAIALHPGIHPGVAVRKRGSTVKTERAWSRQWSSRERATWTGSPKGERAGTSE